LLINFFNLVHVKLIDNNHYDEYYDKFFTYLDNQEDFFTQEFLNIMMNMKN